MESGKVRKVSICIERPADEAYEFLSVPQNFPKWASGLGRTLRKVDGEWIAETPEGPARVSFSERNSFGVLDHSVALPQGGLINVVAHDADKVSLGTLAVMNKEKIARALEGKVKPDYRQAVGISTTAAQKELVSLALLGIVTPIVVGLTLQVEALGGFLAGIIVSGQLLAVFLNNSGGAWDNAKKLIEDEPKDPAKNTGKGSERHKAGVVGDTVGDPFKDTAGPALNPMIKVVNLVSVIVAPIVVQYSGAEGTTVITVWVVALILLGVLAWAVMRSKAPAPSVTEAKAVGATRR